MANPFKNVRTLFFINTSFHAWIEHTRVLYLEKMFCKVAFLFLNHCSFQLEVICRHWRANVSSFVIIQDAMVLSCNIGGKHSHFISSERGKKWGEELESHKPVFFLFLFFTVGCLIDLLHLNISNNNCRPNKGCRKVII